MNKFFTSNDVYNDRINICKKCIYYFKPTGQCKRCLCFMKIKARIASMECPEKYWQKTTEVETPDDLPTEIIEEVLKLWPDIKRGKAKNQQVKKNMVQLYNTIYNANYSWGTNCASCLNTCFTGMKLIYEKYK